MKHIPKGKKVSMETQVFPKLSEKDELFGHVFKDIWTDIGQLEGYLEINKVLLETSEQNTKSKRGEQVKLHKPVAFDNDVLIGRKSTIGPYAVLGQNVTVGENVRIQDSVILPGTLVDDFSSINGAIIGENVTIGKEVKIQQGCALGDHVRLKKGVTLAENVSICPGKEISQSIHTPGHVI
jgi:NDP-sugar pyrophosphorylase family protein